MKNKNFTIVKTYPSCDEKVALSVNVDKGVIESIAVQAVGADACRHEAAIIRLSMKGKTLDEAKAAEAMAFRRIERDSDGRREGLIPWGAFGEIISMWEEDLVGA